MCSRYQWYCIYPDPIVVVRIKRKFLSKYITLRARLWYEAKDTSKIFITGIYKKTNCIGLFIKGKAFNGIDVKNIEYPIDMFLAILGYNPDKCNVMAEQSNFENYIFSTELLSEDEICNHSTKGILPNNTPVTLRYMKSYVDEQVLDTVNVTFISARSTAGFSKYEEGFIELKFQDNKGKIYKVSVDGSGNYKNGDVLGMPMPDYFDYIQIIRREE